MSMGPLLVAAPLLAASIFAAMWTATESFDQNYMETLCRMESVRTHALGNIENDEPLEVNFGGDECLPDASSPTADSQATPTPTTEPSVALIEAQLSQALLTLDDMATGWTEGLAPEHGSAGDLSLCGIGGEASATAQVETGFQQSAIGPFMGQVVKAFPPGEAEAAMAETLAAVQSCGEWIETNADGTQTRWRVSFLAFPQFGDETLALRLSAEAPQFGITTMDLVHVRRGDFVTAVAQSAWGYVVDSALTEALVSRADEKLAALP